MGVSNYEDLRYLHGPNTLSAADDIKTLLDKKIEDNSTISIVWRLRGGAQDISLFVTCFDGKVESVKISGDNTINTLKSLIASKNSILNDKSMNLTF